MTRKSVVERASGYTILVVDDNQEYLKTVCRLLEREGHRVMFAANGLEAIQLLRNHPIDLLLVDYFMPGMTGEEVVTQIREFNTYVQVVLQTGYASERPPRELLKRMNIQGYYDKSEGPDKLLLWVDVGLKAASRLQLLNKSRQGLSYILNATPDLHRIQPLDDLLQGILLQVSGLLGVMNSFLASVSREPVKPSGISAPPNAGGFLAMVDEETKLMIRAGIGHFTDWNKTEQRFSSEKSDLIREALTGGSIRVTEEATIVPLRIGEVTTGVIYLDQPVNDAQDTKLLHVFANQAAVAIQNVQLYEMATNDPLTGVFVRRFFDQWLCREVRSAFRSRQPISLLMIDIDGMKNINDTAGHPAGDQALATVGKVLRQSTRAGDIVGRYGGDEFAIVLPHAPLVGAETVSKRILDFLQTQTVSGPNGSLPLMCSIGLAFLVAPEHEPNEAPRPIPQVYFQDMAQAMVVEADRMLYQAKREGGGRLCVQKRLVWRPFSNGDRDCIP